MLCIAGAFACPASRLRNNCLHSQHVSDVNRKHSFSIISGEDVLAKLRRMPVMSWTCNSESEDVRHPGPTAQDFHKAFDLGGSDDTHIATVDADGVALAAARR
jgi:trimeric autotransporter adhesin